jgi:hypothetical protein
VIELLAFRSVTGGRDKRNDGERGCKNGLQHQVSRSGSGSVLSIDVYHGIRRKNAK